MPDKAPAAATDQWTLIRRARQLITLHGPSGPRRGSALGDIGIIPDGALLIHNGVVEEYGVSRRVENLANARKAREIDASGRIVMPAFVDADTALAYPRFASRRSGGAPRETPLRLLSKRALEGGVAAAALDCVRHGILTVGAHTGYAINLRDTIKVLRIQQAMQGKPLRIRSILSPRVDGLLPDKWFIAARRGKLSMLMDVVEGGFAVENAKMAAHHDFSLRLRASGTTPETIQLAKESGAVAIVAPDPVSGLPAVCVVTAAALLAHPRSLRGDVDVGTAIALATGYGPAFPATQNPQFLLHLAVEQAGLTIEEAITALIHNAACSLRIAHAAGSLEPGKSADLVVMDVPDYRDLTRRAGHNDTAIVIRAGRVVYRRGVFSVE